MKHLLGIDIGGTKTAVVLGGREGAAPAAAPGLRPVDRRAFPTPRGPAATMTAVYAAAEELLRSHGLDTGRLERIGVSCGGPLDSREGRILSPPNLPGWDDVPVVRLLEERFGVETRLQNDADAGALAEWLFGAGRGRRSLVFLTFGTGMGAGLILDGRLYSGANGLAGEVGHVRLAEHGPVGYGKEGSFEGFCSGGGIAQLARTRSLEQAQLGRPSSLSGDVDARAVVEAARAGDPLAGQVLDICAAYLGRGLAVLIDILDPELIVLGGIFTRAGDLLWPAAAAVIEREALPRSRGACAVVPAALGEAIGDYAALAAAAYAEPPAQPAV